MKTLLTISALFCSASLAVAGPALNISQSSLNSFFYVVGAGPSVSQKIQLRSFIMGSMSGTGTVNVAGSTDYEVSLNNTNFSASVSIPYTGDTLGLTSVYIRLKSGLVTGDYNAESVVVTAGSSAISPQSVDVNGVITPAALVATTGAVGATTATLNWSTAGSTPDNWEYVLNKLNAVPPAGGTLINASTYTATGLDAATTYYFHVRSRYGINVTPWVTRSFTTNSSANVTPGTTSLPLAIIPNPSTGAFRIEGDVTAKPGETLQVQILNALGQMVWSTSGQADNGRLRIGIDAALPSGMYTVRIASSAGSRELRLRIAN